MIRLYEAKIFCQFDKMQNQKKPLFPPQDIIFKFVKYYTQKKWKKEKNGRAGERKNPFWLPWLESLKNQLLRVERYLFTGIKWLGYLPSQEMPLTAALFWLKGLLFLHGDTVICIVMGSSSSVPVSSRYPNFKGTLRSFCPWKFTVSVDPLPCSTLIIIARMFHQDSGTEKGDINLMYLLA